MAKRPAKHPFETNPPAQKKQVVADDNWGLAATGLPVDSPKINTNSNNGIAANLESSNHMRPVYYDRDSAYMHESHTDGKKR